MSLVPKERLERAAQVLSRLAAAANASSETNPKAQKVKLSMEEAQKIFAALQGALSHDDPSDCCICFEELSEDRSRILRTCKHVLCETCLEGLTGKQTCIF